MNWITTNIRLPEDVYMQLKIKAARERKSVAAIIREKLVEKREQPHKAQELIEEMRAVSQRIAKENKGINLSQRLIDMRYEQ